MKISFKICIVVLIMLAQFGWACLPPVYADLSQEERDVLNIEHKQYLNDRIYNLLESFRLDDALKYGALHNAGLKKAFYLWRASVEKITQSKSLDDPQLSFKTFLDEVETRVGPQKQMYSIGQKIPFPGKLKVQGEAVTAVARQRFAEFQKIKLELFYEIKDVCFEYWFLYKKILVTRENKLLLERFESVAQLKFKSGLTRNQDLLKAQVELGKLENELLTLHDFRDPVIARLNAVLNRHISAPINWPEEIDHRVISLNKEDLIKRFYLNNPDLIQATQRIEEANRKVLLAKLDYLPDFTIAFDYIRVDEGPLNVVDNGTDATALMLKVNIPIWYGKQKSQMEEARALKTAALAGKEQLERNLEAKIAAVHFKLRDAGRQIRLYQDALIPKAEQSLKASETAYRAGEVDFLHLIDSERILLEFQLSYYRAIRDYEQRLAELEMIVGEPLRGEK